MRLGARSFIVSLVAIAFALTAEAVPRADWASSAALSLASGVAALSLMAMAALLGSRWRAVESAFGGLDRVYDTHKWLGVWALAFASFHFVFKAGLPGWDTAAIMPLPGAATRLARQLSYVALVVIVLLALNRKIPYSTWRWWHKLSGPLFLIVVLHWLSFKSPIALASPAGVWLAVMATLGIAAATYKLLLYRLWSRHAEYRLVSVTTSASAARIELAPVAHGVAFAPGQFAFLSLQHDGLREPHPFTIASAGRPDGRIAFVVRALGDYTTRLVVQAAPGMYAQVYAPFGRFERPPGAAREIWIAGGVGITPFIAWLQDRDADGGGAGGRVTLFHFHTPGRELPDGVDLDGMARRSGVELVPVVGGPDDPAFVQRFAAIATGPDAAGLDISFCGPQGLLRRVRARMREHGLDPARLHHERFEFR